MAVAPTSPIGTTISIVASSPATFNQAGYEALTFVEIDGVLSIGEMGDRSERISADTLKDGRRVYANGILDGVPVAVSMLPDGSDAGQVIVNANNNGATLCSIAVEKPNGDMVYMTGYVADLMDSAIEPNTVVSNNWEFRPAYAPVRVAA